MTKTMDRVLLACLGGIVTATVLLSGRAQSPPVRQVGEATDQLSGWVEGSVVDAVTGGPVSGAIVALAPTGAAMALGPARRTTTKSDGAFAFPEVPPGTYSLTTTAPLAAYAPSGFGKVRADGPTALLDVGADEHVTAITLRLWKAARMAGTLTGQTGTARALTTVLAWRREARGGEFRYAFAGEAQTALDGSFNLPALAPGTYVIGATATGVTVPNELQATFLREVQSRSATGTLLEARLSESGAPLPSRALSAVAAWQFASIAGIRLMPLPFPIGADGTIFLYTPTFHPAATSIAQAAVIQLGASEYRDKIDIKAPIVLATRVSGRVTGPKDLGAHLGVRLAAANYDRRHHVVETPLESAATVTDADGSFTFLGVAPGDYELQAWTMHDDDAPSPFAGRPALNGRPVGRAGLGLTAIATRPVTVTAKGVTGLAIELVRPPRLTGQLQFDGPSPPQSSELDNITLQLDPVGAAGWPLPQPSRASVTGTFVFDGYAPGSYVMPSPLAGSWRVKSVTLDGRDVTDGPIDLDARDHAIVVTVTTSAASLSGALTPIEGTQPLDIRLLVFPVDYHSWIDHDLPARTSRDLRLTGGWTYRCTGLPPGDYLIVAFREGDADALDADFVERLAHLATRISLTAADTQAPRLSIVNIRSAAYHQIHASTVAPARIR